MFVSTATPNTPFAMNTMSTTLTAFALVLSASCVNAQTEAAGILRGSAPTDEVTKPSFFTSAANFFAGTVDMTGMKGQSASQNFNSATQANDMARGTLNQTVYLEATVVIRGNAFQAGQQMMLRTKGRTEQQAMAKLQDKVGRLANAQITSIQTYVVL